MQYTAVYVKDFYWINIHVLSVIYTLITDGANKAKVKI